MSAQLSNDSIAERFDLLADLLELEGAVAYRVLAYRRAAKTLRETPESVVRLSQQGRLTELSGVGDTISDKVAELIATGQIAALEKLVKATPPGVVPLMHVPGVGPKTAKRVFSELGVSTVDEVLAGRPRRPHPRPAGDGREDRAGDPGGTGHADRATARPHLGRPRAAVRRGHRGRAVGAARGRPVRARRQPAPLHRDGQGHRHRGRHARAGRRRRGLRRRRLGGRGGGARRQQAHLRCPRRHPRRAADGRPAGVRQPAAAPDRLQASQRRPARGGREGQAEGQRVRHRAGRDRRAAALPRRGAGVRAAGHGLGAAGAAREPRRAGGGPPPRAARPGQARGHPRRPALPHRLERRQADARAVGRGGAGEGLRVPERDRPLARGRLRHGARRRPAAQADRAGAGAGRDAGRLHAAGGRRGGHPQGRLARLLRRADGRAGRGGGQPACLAPAQRGRPDQAPLLGHGEPARGHHRATPPAACWAAARPTRWTWRR